MTCDWCGKEIKPLEEYAEAPGENDISWDIVCKNCWISQLQVYEGGEK